MKHLISASLPSHGYPPHSMYSCNAFVCSKCKDVVWKCFEIWSVSILGDDSMWWIYFILAWIHYLLPSITYSRRSGILESPVFYRASQLAPDFRFRTPNHPSKTSILGEEPGCHFFVIWLDYPEKWGYISNKRELGRLLIRGLTLWIVIIHCKMKGKSCGIWPCKAKASVFIFLNMNAAWVLTGSLLGV